MMSFNKSVSKLLILCLLIGISSVDVQGYYVEAAIKPTPSIKSSASFYVVSSIEPVENHTSSPSFFVSGDITYGTPEQSITPVTPTPAPSTPSTGSSSGGRGKYDASNWLLERKYNELAFAGRDIPEDEGYTSAPKKDRTPLEPFPVDEFEETIPVVDTEVPVVETPVAAVPTEKDLQTNIFKPREEVIVPVTSIFEVQSFEDLRKPIEEGKILNLPGSLFVTIDLEQDERMFPLYPSSQNRVTFSEKCESCSTFVVVGSCLRYVLCLFWILILLIFVNLCLLFWQLLIVDRLIHDKEKKENKFKKFFKNLYKKFILLFK